jgi:hypothetical protein
MQLRRRVKDLEQRMTPGGIKRWVRIFQYEDQTQEQAVTAYEAQNGPIEDSMGVILRVIVDKPGASPARARTDPVGNGNSL